MNRELSTSAKVVFSLLAAYSWDGRCSFGLRRIALLASLSKGTVCVALAALKDAGYVNAELGIDGRNAYQIRGLAKPAALIKRASSRTSSPLLTGVAVCPNCTASIDLEKDLLIPNELNEEVA